MLGKVNEAHSDPMDVRHLPSSDALEVTRGPRRGKRLKIGELPVRAAPDYLIDPQSELCKSSRVPAGHCVDRELAAPRQNARKTVRVQRVEQGGDPRPVPASRTTCQAHRVQAQRAPCAARSACSTVPEQPRDPALRCAAVGNPAGWPIRRERLLLGHWGERRGFECRYRWAQTH